MLDLETHIMSQRILYLAATLVSAGALSACATLNDVAQGTPLTQITARFGQPDSSCPLPGGGQRVIWTQQPLGQYAWAANVNAEGLADRVQPALTDEHFKVLAQGEWTPERLRCEFGRPAEIREVGLPSVREKVWAYRYRQDGAWNSLMYVYMGADGQHMTRFHPGPDPMYEERDRWGGWM